MAIPIRNELDWVLGQHIEKEGPWKICQCESEKIIINSMDAKRMRASLISLVFLDQLMFSHYHSLYECFRKEYSIPKLVSHSFGSYASPSWLVDHKQGFDQEADWQLVSKIFTACVKDLSFWLRDKSPADISLLGSFIEIEVIKEFHIDDRRYFQTRGLCL